MSEKRCLVAICHNGPTVFTDVTQSLMEIGWGDSIPYAKAQHGFANIDFAWSRSFPRVDTLRDWIVQRALSHPAGYTHLLFLDADMIWPRLVIERMLRHHGRKAIVSGMYHLKGGDFAPVAMRDGFQENGSTLTQYWHDRDYRQTGDALRPQQVVGMGCTVMPLSVFRDIGERPWFAYANDDEGWPLVSEDVTFCRKAAAAGYEILLDPSVKCGHVTTKTVTEKWHLAAHDGMVQALMQAASQ